MPRPAHLLVSVAVAAGCGGSSGGDQAAPTLRYVEGDRPVPGAPVLISTLLGDPLLETTTNADGAVALDLEEPALVTIGRSTAPTWWNLNIFTLEPDDEVLSVVVAPSESVTLGSTVPAINASIAGHVVLQFADAAPDTDLYELSTSSGVNDSATYIETLGTSIPVAAEAVDSGSLTILVWGVYADRKTAYATVDVDLAPIRGGQDEVLVEMPPWRTDFDEIPVAVTGVSDLFVSADTYLWRDGQRYPLGTDYGHTPGSPLPDPVEISVQVPPAFADQLDIRAFNSDDLSPHWLGAGERLPATPGEVTFDIGGTAPPGCYNIAFEVLDSGLVQVSWDGGGGSEDAVDVRLVGIPVSGPVGPPWHLLLPPGTTDVVLPLLPASLASSQVHPDLGLDATVYHHDLSTTADYSTFLAATAAGGFDAAAVGDTLRLGACRLSN